jgi:hypothetical protein
MIYKVEYLTHEFGVCGVLLLEPASSLAAAIQNACESATPEAAGLRFLGADGRVIWGQALTPP